MLGYPSVEAVSSQIASMTSASPHKAMVKHAVGVGEHSGELCCLCTGTHIAVSHGVFVTPAFVMHHITARCSEARTAAGVYSVQCAR